MLSQVNSKQDCLVYVILNTENIFQMAELRPRWKSNGF